MLSLLKSKKIWITILGCIVCAILWFFKATPELIISVASLFGLDVIAHSVTDIVSLWKGQQVKNERK